MRLETRHFGEIDVDTSKILYFDEGIPGFQDHHKFILLSNPDEKEKNDTVFYWLQSIEDGGLCFVLMDVTSVMPDYNPLVEQEEISDLGEYNPENFFFYNIAKFPDDIKDATVNLKAPIVINNDIRKGKQVICTNDEYTVSHFMFK